MHHRGSSAALLSGNERPLDHRDYRGLLALPSARLPALAFVHAANVALVHFDGALQFFEF